jgi:hypothetical protein
MAITDGVRHGAAQGSVLYVTRGFFLRILYGGLPHEFRGVKVLLIGRPIRSGGLKSGGCSECARPG